MSVQAPCQNHSEQKAVYQCLSCKGLFCKDCIAIKHYMDFTMTASICNVCGGKCEEIDAKKVTLEKEQIPDTIEKKVTVQKSEEKIDILPSSPPIETVNFWLQLPDIFIFPFRGNGKVMILVGAFLFAMLSTVINTLWGIPMIFVVLYTVAYLVKIIDVSAFSATEEPPDWPEVRHWLDWVSITLVFFLAALICFGPPVWYFYKLLALDMKFWLLLGLGIYLYPMYILAISLNEKLEFLNPLVIIDAVLRTFFPYIVVIIVWVGLLSIHHATRQTPFIYIPLLGQLLEWVLFMYLLLVFTRLLGVFYRAYQRRLNWFGEGPG